MFLYIDHLFAEGREREVKPLHSIPDTLSELYLLAMREHRRKAVLRFEDGGEWADVPDWRFDRHTIRLGLYLENRGLLKSGDRIALIAPLRPEWPSIDLSAICSGAVCVSLPSDASREAIGAALAAERPRVGYVDAAVYPRLRSILDLFEEIEAVIVLDDAVPEDDAVSYVTALDLGGTDDTPENAQKFRARARELSASALAFRHYRPGAGEELEPVEFTHEQVLQELESLWSRAPAEEGDRVYVAPGEVSLATRLALYAHIGDGYSTIYLGSPEREPQQIAELAPQAIIAPAETLEATIEGSGRGDGGGDEEERLENSRGWLARLTRRARPTQQKNAVREALGGRVRCVSPTTPPDPTLSALLNSAVSEAATRHADSATHS